MSFTVYVCPKCRGQLDHPGDVCWCDGHKHRAVPVETFTAEEVGERLTTDKVIETLSFTSPPAEDMHPMTLKELLNTALAAAFPEPTEHPEDLYSETGEEN